MLNTRAATAALRRHQRGMTLVELMVGLTVGMIVVAGAVLLTTSQIGEHKRLILETQVQQDLRAAADLMLRELRQAGAWGQARNTVWTPSNAASSVNPYQDLEVKGGGTEVNYSYTKDSKDTPEDNRLTQDETYGFRLRASRLEYLIGGSYQPLTDPNTLKMTGFLVNVNSQGLALPDLCNGPCPPDQTPCMRVRDVTIRLEGEAAHDKDVVRTLTVRARVRNDQVVKTAPAAC